MVQKGATVVTGYGLVHKSLHWLIMALLVLQFAIAWSMPEVHRDTRPEGLIGMHLTVGAVILLLMIVRLLWRWRYPVTPLGGAMPAWQRRGAQLIHRLIYLLLLLLPLMGWANASSRGWTVELFALGSLPPILPTNSPFGHALGDTHTAVSYALLCLIGLHLTAVLYHQYWLRDQIVSRMLGRNG